jgi:hypothetical protein
MDALLESDEKASPRFCATLVVLIGCEGNVDAQSVASVKVVDSAGFYRGWFDVAKVVCIRTSRTWVIRLINLAMGRPKSSCCSSGRTRLFLLVFIRLLICLVSNLLRV